MNPESQATYEEIANLSTQTEAIYKKLEIEIPEESDLKKYITLCKEIATSSEKPEKKDHLSINRALQAFTAITQCEKQLIRPDEIIAFKSSLTQIARNSLRPRTPGGSHGLNMLFELDLLQYLRHRGLNARLGEPDIVISTPFGNYHIACKTINSLNKIRRNLTKGATQIKKQGHGAIAINLEPQMYLDEPLRTRTAFEARDILDSNLKSIYSQHEKTLNQYLADSEFDGVMIQTSCIAEIEESPTELDMITHSVFYSRSNIQSKDASNRFANFKYSMLGPLSQ